MTTRLRYAFIIAYYYLTPTRIRTWIRVGQSASTIQDVLKLMAHDNTTWPTLIDIAKHIDWLKQTFGDQHETK